MKTSPLLPPTSCEVAAATRPGVSATKAGSVLLVGRVSSASFEITLRDSTRRTSTTGLSLRTVIVSSSAPTRISPLTVAVKFGPSSIPSRRTVLKPGSENATAYVPGLSSTML
jgi:hypothetical protein